jgi:hypothetical protein
MGDTLQLLNFINAVAHDKPAPNPHKIVFLPFKSVAFNSEAIVSGTDAELVFP